jgi:hypothetical protein
LGLGHASSTIFFDLTNYTLHARHARYAPIDDTFDPNQSEASAPIALGNTIHACDSRRLLDPRLALIVTQ